MNALFACLLCQNPFLWLFALLATSIFLYFFLALATLSKYKRGSKRRADFLRGMWSKCVKSSLKHRLKDM